MHNTTCLAPIEEDLAVLNLQHDRFLKSLLLFTKVFEYFNLESFFTDLIISGIDFEIRHPLLNLMSSFSITKVSLSLSFVLGGFGCKMRY